MSSRERRYLAYRLLECDLFSLGFGVSSNGSGRYTARESVVSRTAWATLPGELFRPRTARGPSYGCHRSSVAPAAAMLQRSESGARNGAAQAPLARPSWPRCTCGVPRSAVSAATGCCCTSRAAPRISRGTTRECRLGQPMSTCFQRCTVFHHALVPRHPGLAVVFVQIDGPIGELMITAVAVGVPLAPFWPRVDRAPRIGPTRDPLGDESARNAGMRRAGACQSAARRSGLLRSPVGVPERFASGLTRDSTESRVIGPSRTPSSSRPSAWRRLVPLLLQKIIGQRLRRGSVAVRSDATVLA